MPVERPPADRPPAERPPPPAREKLLKEEIGLGEARLFFWLTCHLMLKCILMQ